MSDEGRHDASQRFRSKIANFLLALITTVLALILLEIGVRLIYVPASTLGTHRIPHPTLGWHLEPGAHFRNRNWEYDVTIAYNSHGWRDREHDYEKAPDTTRIVVLGDSFMEAYSVDLEQSFAVQLEEEAASRGLDQVEVINLGVGGYGTLQEYLAFEEEGIRYQPDIVLVGFYAENDVRDNSRRLEAERGIDSAKYSNRPFLLPGDADEWEVTDVDFEASQAAYEAAKRQLSYSRSALLSMLREIVESQRLAAPAGLADNAAIPLMVHACDLSPGWQEGWDITSRIFARLKQDVEAAGADLIVFGVPSMETIDVDYQEEVLSIVDNPEQYCVSEMAGYARLRAILAENDISYVDLHPAFEAASGEGQSLFWQSDRHWNAVGHRIAAEVVLSALEAGDHPGMTP